MSLTELINEYLADVEKAISLLSTTGIARPNSALEWAMNGIDNIGVLPDGASYRKHGYGCEVTTRSWAVDFDFNQQGQVAGVEVGRLERYWVSRGSGYGLASSSELRAAFHEAVRSGYLVEAASGFYRIAANNSLQARRP